jgi:hypothetical protein
MLGCQDKPGAKDAKTVDAPPVAKAVEPVRIENEAVEVVVKPAAFMDAAVVQAFVDELKKLKLPMMPVDLSEKSPEESLKELLGMDPASIISITASLDPVNEKALVTAVASEDVALEDVLAAFGATAGEEFAKIAEHQGVALYGPEGETEAAIAFVDARVVVVGDIADLKTGIDAYKAGKLPKAPAGIATLLKDAPAGANLVIAVDMTAEMQSAAPAAGLDPALAEGVSSVLIALTAADQLDIFVKVVAKTDEAAAQMREMAAGGLETAKAQVVPMFGGAEGKPVVDAVNGVRIAGSGKIVEATASIGADVVAPVGNVLSVLFQMGGMN